MSGLLGILRRVPQQYPTIQAGINASVHGDTVFVSEGTYLENIKYRGKRIIIASLYLLDQDTSHISRTIIDGSQGVDTGSVVCFVSGEDTNSVLCGFTVRGGYGTYIPAWDEGDGGGVFLWQSGGRLVRNIITGNNVEASNAWGGGVSTAGLTNVGQTLIMEDNIITKNLASATTGYGFGGGVSILRSQFRLTGNVFEYDSVRGMVQAGASGAFIYLSSGNLGVIHGNVFRNTIALGDSSSYALLRSKEPKQKDNPLLADEFILTEKSGAKQTLYIEPETSQAGAMSELPPQGPEGTFDARFASQKSIESANSSAGQTIVIRSSSYPVTFTWNLKDEDGGYVVTDGVNGTLMAPRHIAGKGELVITDPAITRLVLLKEQGVPHEFVLDQNYPNPFNPTTQIKFAVANAGPATVEMFDVLGQKVKTLFNENAEPGKYYNLRVDGADMASGVYFYRLQSGARLDTRKMLLLK